MPSNGVISIYHYELGSFQMVNRHYEIKPLERIAIATSREILDETVIVGTGLPVMAAMIAKRILSKHAHIMFESGFVDSNTEEMPRVVDDVNLIDNSKQVIRIVDMLGLLQTGRIDLGILGCAQIDKEGNINTTCIGPYDKPKVRLPGAGGAPDIARYAKRVIVITKHEKRRFPEHVDYVTSKPTNLDRVITDLCIFNGKMEVIALQPYISIEDVRANTGFDVNECHTQYEPRSYKEMALLKQLDPERYYLD